jgi:hypothetical protein
VLDLGDGGRLRDLWRNLRHCRVHDDIEKVLAQLQPALARKRRVFGNGQGISLLDRGIELLNERGGLTRVFSAWFARMQLAPRV